MGSLLIASVVFAASMVGMIAGFSLRSRLPGDHLDGGSKDAIQHGIGLIATMVALVIGLLVASAKTAFDSEVDGFARLSTDVIVLDRSLAAYGPEAAPVREALRGVVETAVAAIWPEQGSGTDTQGVDAGVITARGLAFAKAVHALDPKTDGQRAILKQALDLGVELSKIRWSLGQPSPPLLPLPFLAVLTFWLGVLFAGFALLTPRNTTVVVTLSVCAASIAASIFLIIDLGEPMDGLIRIPSDSLRYAISQIGG